MNKRPNVILAFKHERYRPIVAAMSDKTGMDVTVVTAPGDLTFEAIARLDPSRIFFLHWSWKIPAAIHSRWECIVFHMTDVPFGRGGSPLQNLIARGLETTKLTALRCVEEMDAGDVYLKEDLSLAGTAEEIFARAAALMPSMIRRIVTEGIQPVPQRGEVVIFKRRTPEQSELPRQVSVQGVHDHIRMLDAEGYPRAFVRHGNARIEFSQARVVGGKVVAIATFDFTSGQHHE
jgi:methionyl-tRNA formyltransferase